MWLGGGTDGFNFYQGEWKMGTDGSITSDIDCSQYQVGDMAISTLDDNDIDSMIGNMYVSIVNPASGMALSVEGSGCGDNVAGGPVSLYTYDENDSKQKFRLIKTGDLIVFESQFCAGQAGQLLSVIDCNDGQSGMILGPREVSHIPWC